MTKQTKRRTVVAVIVGLIIGAFYVVGKAYGYEPGNGAWAFGVY